MIDTRRSTTPGIWEVADTKSLSERLREAASTWRDVRHAESLREAADALDAKDAEIARLREKSNTLIVVGAGGEI